MLQVCSNEVTSAFPYSVEGSDESGKTTETPEDENIVVRKGSTQRLSEIIRSLLCY